MARTKAQKREHEVFGVPARFMSPRLIFCVCVVVLSLFGLLMIYSASSVTSLISADTNFDPAYYVKRQAIFLAAGTVAAIVLASIDYHTWSGSILTGVWVLTVVMLLAIFASSMGQGAYGASRWIGIGSFSLQPSEFAKVTVVLTAANLAQRYFDDASIDFDRFIKLMGIGVGLPLILILAQPDKGTTMVLAATLLVMGYLAGLPRNLILGIYTGLLAYPAARTGLSVHLLSRYSFGVFGSDIPSTVLAVTQIGWFGVGACSRSSRCSAGPARASPRTPPTSPVASSPRVARGSSSSSCSSTCAACSA